MPWETVGSTNEMCNHSLLLWSHSWSSMFGSVFVRTTLRNRCFFLDILVHSLQIVVENYSSSALFIRMKCRGQRILHCYTATWYILILCWCHQTAQLSHFAWILQIIISTFSTAIFKICYSPRQAWIAISLFVTLCVLALQAR